MNKKLISLGTILAGLYVSGNAANIALVPQTGQTATLPLTAPTNSDGALRKGAAWPTARFTQDASGNCITDNLTGLMWVKDLNTVNGGNTLGWNTALTTANSGTWCGYSDWRVPNINELRSLVNYGYGNQANWLNTAIASGGGGFRNVQAYNYWSSSGYAKFTTGAWFVHMLNGDIGPGAKSDSTGTRLFPVRGGR